MRPYETYQSNAAEVPVMRKWLFRALILSLLIHAGLFFWSRTKKLDRFSQVTDRLVLRAFTVNRLVIDSSLLDSGEKESQAQPDMKKVPAPQVQIPAERPEFDKMMTQVRAAPDAADTAKPILNEKPRVDSANLNAMVRVQENAAKTMERDMETFHDDLISDAPASANRPVIKTNSDFARRLPAGNSTDAAAMAAASGRLDSLLGRGLKGNDAPLQLPGGALFAFDSDALNPEAIKLLEKVALLIQKNPGVTFAIEGYTDSFGSPQHNMDLSSRRAESVRAWILQWISANNIQIDPSHIQTKGFGGTHFRVEPQPVEGASQAAIDAEIARQQPNRRVEIVFQLPSGN